MSVWYKKIIVCIILMVFSGVCVTYAIDSKEETAVFCIKDERALCYNSLDPSFKNIPYQTKKYQRYKKVEEKSLYVSSAEELRFARPSVLYLSVGHIEGKGVCYDEGYTTVEGMLFFPYLKRSIFPFLDLRYHVFNDGTSAVNAGAGIRFVPAMSSKIFGFNLFYDFRNTPRHVDCHQIGVGAEFLSGIVDFRLNGYFPIQKWNLYHYCYFDGYLGSYFIERKQYEYVFTGVDAEIGIPLIKRGNFLFYGALGSYYMGENICLSSITGVKARFEVDVNQFFFFDISVTHDHVYKTRAQGQITFRLPLWKHSSGRKTLAQPVERNEIIPTGDLSKWRWNY